MCYVQHHKQHPGGAFIKRLPEGGVYRPFHLYSVAMGTTRIQLTSCQTLYSHSQALAQEVVVCLLVCGHKSCKTELSLILILFPIERVGGDVISLVYPSHSCQQTMRSVSEVESCDVSDVICSAGLLATGVLLTPCSFDTDIRRSQNYYLRRLWIIWMVMISN